MERPELAVYTVLPRIDNSVKQPVHCRSAQLSDSRFAAGLPDPYLGAWALPRVDSFACMAACWDRAVCGSPFTQYTAGARVVSNSRFTAGLPDL